MKNEAAIVSSASSEIGVAITEALLQEGIRVAATYNESKGVIDTFEEQYGESQVASFRVDFLSDEYDSTIEQVVEDVRDRWGRLDTLVNVAGIWFVKPFLYETQEKVEHVWRINYWTPYKFMQAALPHMLERGGQIVNLVSTAGAKGTGQQATYSASKGALLRLTESTAEEFAARNVRINAISPGPTDTKALDKYLDDTSKKLLVKQIPRGRLCKPEDVADSVLYILENDYLTGENILLDGGRM